MVSTHELVVRLAIEDYGDWNKIYEDVKNKRDLEKDIDLSKVDAITILDTEYPSILRNIYKPPFVLFYKGSLSLLDHLDNTLAILGNRKSTASGDKTTCDIVMNNKDKILVSGGSVGIQATACRQAMDLHMPIILILGCGIDKNYLPENKDIYDYCRTNGLILSEYPFDTPPSPDNFTFRNRIIAALSKNIVVVEISRNTGTMITISYALNMNKDIYVVPQSYNSDLYNNTLISEGAIPYLKTVGLTVDNRTCL